MIQTKLDKTSDYASFDDIASFGGHLIWDNQAGEGNGVRFGLTGIGEYVSTINLSPVGHFGGVLGIGQMNSVGTNAYLVIGTEGRGGVKNGTATIVCGLLGTLDKVSENNGTATLGAQIYLPPITTAEAAHYTYPFALYAPGKDLDSRIDGRLLLGLGGSTERMTASGRADTGTGPTGNVGGGEDTLYSFTLPANSLSANGKAIKYRTAGYITNNANAKVLKVYFGSTTVLTHTFATSITTGFDVDLVVVREGASKQRAICTLTTTGAAGVAINVVTASSPAHDTTTEAVLKVTATGVADSDIVGIFAVTEFLN